MRKSVDNNCPISSSFNTPVPFQFGANGLFYIIRGNVPLEQYKTIDRSGLIYHTNTVTISSLQSCDYRILRIVVYDYHNAESFDFFGGDLIICVKNAEGNYKYGVENFIFIPYLNFFYKLDDTLQSDETADLRIYDRFIKPWQNCSAKLRCIAALHRLSFQLIKNSNLTTTHENFHELVHLQTLINTWGNINSEVVELFDGYEEKQKLIKKPALDKTKNFITPDTHRRIRLD